MLASDRRGFPRGEIQDFGLDRAVVRDKLIEIRRNHVEWQAEERDYFAAARRCGGEDQSHANAFTGVAESGAASGSRDRVAWDKGSRCRSMDAM